MPAPTTPRRTRPFALGAPGANIRITYQPTAPGDRTWSLLGGGVAALIGVANLLAGHLAFGVGGLLFGAFFVVPLVFAPSLGEVILDREAITLGVGAGAKRIPLASIVGTTRSRPAGLFSSRNGGREDWAVQAMKGPGFDVGVARLDRATIDELEARIALRVRAGGLDDERALEALEARHEGGPAAIGSRLTDEGWRPVHEVTELRSLAKHPFRDAEERIPVCIRADVWEALRSASPDVARRLEPIVVDT